MTGRPATFELEGIGTFTNDPSWWDTYYRGPDFPIEVLGQPVTFALGYGPIEGRAAELVIEAINNFRAAGSELRDEVARYMVEYYQSVRNMFSEEECVDYDIPLDVSVENVWEHVSFRHPPTLEPSLDDRGGLHHADIAYISFEGGCSWEIEHGMQLVFLHGQRVCKIGNYTGHPTNAATAANPDLLDVVLRH